MGFTALMVLMGLLGGVCSSPVCEDPCISTSTINLPHFQHVMDPQYSSVAPWNLVVNTSEDREPQLIQHAVCKNCTVKDMIAKPIFIQISVYNRIRNSVSWCKCPYNLAVGCTCVNAQRQ